jgi:hypothetical protein
MGWMGLLNLRGKIHAIYDNLEDPGIGWWIILKLHFNECGITM